jgi:prepilin-type N-terminal cleavage/methylation domain-containing protein
MIFRWLANSRRRSRVRRDAFTLMELLLVLALMVAIAAIAWPALRGSFDTQRLGKAADQLRAAFGKTRVRAMRTGAIHVFRFQPGRAGYGSETWTASAEEVVSAVTAAGGVASGQATPTMTAPSTSSTDTLPDGVVFHLAEVTVDARAANLLGAGGQGGDGETAEWSSPIFFYPDGTTSNTHVVLANERGQAIVVTLRGLTGLALPSDITSLEQLAR